MATPELVHYPGGRRAKAVSLALRCLLRPLMTTWPLTPRAIAPLVLIDRLGTALLRPPRGTAVARLDVAGRPAERIAAPGVPDQGQVILYFHGGAFVACGLGTHRRMAAQVSESAGMPVLSVDYGMLPDCDLAGSVVDSVAAYRWLLAEGFGPEDIAVVGDSAGGHLAIALVATCRAEGLPIPAAIVAMSPWLDFDLAAKRDHRNARRDAYIPVSRMPELARLLCAGEPTAGFSLVDLELAGFPPTLIQVSSTEVLLCDAELMADRMAAAGVSVRLEIWEDQIHVFQILAGLVPEGRAAIGQIGAFVRDVLAVDAAAGRAPQAAAG